MPCPRTGRTVGSSSIRRQDSQHRGFTIRSCRRTWQHWCLWRSSEGEDPLAASEAAPLAFMHAVVHSKKARDAKNRAPRTVPTTRFSYLEWVEANLGAPVKVDVSDRPGEEDSWRSDTPRPASSYRPRGAHVLGPPRGAAAQEQPSQHRGGHHPAPVAERIAVPAPSCMKCAGKERGSPASGGPAPGAVPQAPTWARPFGKICSRLLKAVSRHHSDTCMRPTECCSCWPSPTMRIEPCSRSTWRRRGPKRSPHIPCGGVCRPWPRCGEFIRTTQKCWGIGPLRVPKFAYVRYADACEERAAVVKLEQMLVVRQMAQSQAVLPWDTCRCLVGKVGNKEISVQGHRMFADEIVEEETAAHLLQGLAKPKRRFNVAALAARMRGERIGAVAPPVVQPAQSQAASGPQQEPGELLPVEAPGSSRRWVMVRWLGAPRVHLLQDGSGTPLCRMRQGDAGRPIVRLAGASTGLGGLDRMGWGAGAVCAACAHAVPAGGRNSLR